IADSADALAETVVHGLRDPEFRDRLRMGGREIVTTIHNPLSIAQTYYDQLRPIAADTHERPMRVAFDMRWMIPGVAGGLENLARALLQQVIELDGHNRYTVILPACSRYDFD